MSDTKIDNSLDFEMDIEELYAKCGIKEYNKLIERLADLKSKATLLEFSMTHKDSVQLNLKNPEIQLINIYQSQLANYERLRKLLIEYVEESSFYPKMEKNELWA